MLVYEKMRQFLLNVDSRLIHIHPNFSFHCQNAFDRGIDVFNRYLFFGNGSAQFWDSTLEVTCQQDVIAGLEGCHITVDVVGDGIVADCLHLKTIRYDYPFKFEASSKETNIFFRE